jgi:hypothetical protein
VTFPHDGDCDSCDGGLRPWGARPSSTDVSLYEDSPLDVGNRFGILGAGGIVQKGHWAGLGDSTTDSTTDSSGATTDSSAATATTTPANAPVTLDGYAETVGNNEALILGGGAVAAVALGLGIGYLIFRRRR